MTAKTTVKVAVGLVILKTVTFLFTNSSGILSSAADSLFDVCASLLVLWAIIEAERPADADHPWGHGKAEGLASLFQGVLILVTGLSLVAHSVTRFFDADDTGFEFAYLGVTVMVISSAATAWLVVNLRRTAAKTNSPALAADSQHYTSDLLVNLSVIVGLLTGQFINARWPDLVVGLIIALIILNSAREIFLSSIEILMDRGLKAKESRAILEAVHSFAPRVAGFHDLRSRRSGSDIFIELHLDLSRDLSFVEAHDISEDVGEAIRRKLTNATITVHADPL
ncbi:MAG: cation diffusion facilitator family transporter [Planctomycetota bacterium]|jgi:ferrous-iron efflux pump FieF|nr:cation diffusion facilitator family transporter [Planctomycetota bacterium]